MSPHCGDHHRGWLTVILCCLVGILEGFDLLAAGVAGPRLAPLFGLGPVLLGFFFSSCSFGIMIGGVIGGRLSDYFGRKSILLTSIALFGAMSIFNGLSGGVSSLLVTRFLTGVGLGGALANLIALVAENTKQERRGFAVATLYASFPVGGAVASLMTFLNNSPEGWRMLFFVGGSAPLAVIPLLYWFLPDSRRLQPSANIARPAISTALFEQGRGSITLLLWTAFLLGLSILHLMLNWLPSLLVARGISRADSSLVQMVFTISGAIGSLLVGYILDRSSKALIVILVFLLGIASILLLAMAPATLKMSILAGAAVGLTIMSSQMILYGLAPECYPTLVRGTGVGAAIAAGRFGSIIGPLFPTVLLEAGLGNRQILLALLPLFACSAGASAILARRINGKYLTEKME